MLDIMSVMLSIHRLAKATMVWNPEIQRYSKSLWICGTWGRLGQAFGEYRNFVDAGCINLILAQNERTCHERQTSDFAV